MSEPRSPARPEAERDALDRRLARALRPPPVPVAAADEPDDDTVLRVAEDRATDGERRRVAAAPLAAEALAILRADPPAAPAAAAPRYVFTVAGGVVELLRGPTAPLPGARGAACAIRHPLGDVEAHLGVGPTRGAAAAVDLEVRLVACGAPVAGTQVAVRHDGRAVDGRSTDRSGVARFAGLLPDRYEVELRPADGVAFILRIDVFLA